MLRLLRAAGDARIRTCTKGLNIVLLNSMCVTPHPQTAGCSSVFELLEMADDARRDALAPLGLSEQQMGELAAVANRYPDINVSHGAIGAEQAGGVRGRGLNWRYRDGWGEGPSRRPWQTATRTSTCRGCGSRWEMACACSGQTSAHQEMHGTGTTGREACCCCFAGRYSS